MGWKRFDKEMPTEEGQYAISYENIISKFVFPLEECRLLAQHGATHWLLIQPPKGDKK
jgi:hypothetical protein